MSRIKSICNYCGMDLTPYNRYVYYLSSRKKMVTTNMCQLCYHEKNCATYRRRKALSKKVPDSMRVHTKSEEQFVAMAKKYNEEHPFDPKIVEGLVEMLSYLDYSCFKIKY